jgi:hypothetical protein
MAAFPMNDFPNAIKWPEKMKASRSNDGRLKRKPLKHLPAGATAVKTKTGRSSSPF